VSAVSQSDGSAVLAAAARTVALFTLVVLALATSLSSDAVAADAPLTAQQEQGKKLYSGTCYYCHSEKVWGTLALERRRGPNDALLEKRTDLVPAFVKTVVRNGLGSMPAYRRTELTDADVDAIVAYLTRANLSR
jgi:(+)-pinoresinol hydroxylase